MGEEYSLEKEYQRINKRGVRKQKKWPKNMKNLRWEEGFIHPLTATIYLDLRRFTKRVIHDPENNFMVLQLFYLSVWKILKRYDCYVEKQTGDGLMIVFPINKDSEIEKPIVMAREILKYFVNELNPFINSKGIETLEMGIGIDAGETIVTKVGLPRYESHLMLFGNETNFAAKISRLGKNEILIGCSYKERLARRNKSYSNIAEKGKLMYVMKNHPIKACNHKRYRVFKVS